MGQIFLMMMLTSIEIYCILVTLYCGSKNVLLLINFKTMLSEKTIQGAQDNIARFHTFFIGNKVITVGTVI